MIPTLQSLWFADAVALNPATGKVDVTGIFDQIAVPAGVDYTDGATVFFAVRGVHGQARLQLLYVDLEDDATLLERPLTLEGGPLETIDVSVRVNRVPVPHPGAYAWELHCEGHLLGTARIDAVAGT